MQIRRHQSSVRRGFSGVVMLCALALVLGSLGLVDSLDAGVLPQDGDARYELIFWESIRDSDRPEDYEAYLKAFPKGRFAPLAKARAVYLRKGAAKAEPGPGAKIEEVEADEGNVAGIDIPLFKGVRFKEIGYDLHATPLWLDRAIEEIKGVLTILAHVRLLQEQISRLKEELRVTNQRVNLFEKVMIPRTLENIRMIHVFLSDQQTAAVVRGKIAKGKIGRENEAVRG